MVKLLSGGNPQIPKGEGDAPVQAYISAMPGWKREVGRAARRDHRGGRPRRPQGGQMELALLRRSGPGGLVPEFPRFHPVREGDLLPRHLARPRAGGQVEASGSPLPRHPRGPTRRSAVRRLGEAGQRDCPARRCERRLTGPWHPAGLGQLESAELERRGDNTGDERVPGGSVFDGRGGLQTRRVPAISSSKETGTKKSRSPNLSAR